MVYFPFLYMEHIRVLCLKGKITVLFGNVSNRTLKISSLGILPTITNILNPPNDNREMVNKIFYFFLDATNMEIKKILLLLIYLLLLLLIFLIIWFV